MHHIESITNGESRGVGGGGGGGVFTIRRGDNKASLSIVSLVANSVANP